MNNYKLLFVFLIILTILSCETSSLKVDLIPVESGNKWGFVNTDGEYIINPQFRKATSFQDGIAKVKSLGDKSKYGFINEDGKYIINPLYTSATVFSEGFACVTTENSAPFYIDETGKTLFKLQNAQSAYVFSEGLAVFSEYIYNSEKKSNELLFGFIDKTGNKKIPAQFDDVESFSCGFSAVKNRDNLWGFINNEGLIAINFQFEKAELFSEDIAVVYNGEKWGAINTDGRYIINPQFDKLSMFNEGKAIYVKDNKRGYINNEGKIVVDAQFDKARLYSNGLACVKTNGLWGYIDKEGSYVINPQFKEASSFYGNIAIVKSGDKFGIINKEGSFIANPQFNDVYSIVIDYPTFNNIGLVSYNDLYVKTNYYDVSKVVNSIIRDISTESVNDIYQKSNINEILPYLNNISLKTIKTSSFSRYDYEVNISNVKVSKDVFYSFNIKFKDGIMTRKRNKYGYTDYSAGYVVNKKNSVKSLIYKINLSGTAKNKKQKILDAFETKLSVLEKLSKSNSNKKHFKGGDYNCELRLYNNQIRLIFYFDKNINPDVFDDNNDETGIYSYSPSEVAEEFLIALAEQDYKRAKGFGTEETGQLLNIMIELASMNNTEELEAEKENIKSLRMGEVEIYGDNAVVYYSTDKKGIDKIYLQKVSGQWKVDLKKEM